MRIDAICDSAWTLLSGCPGWTTPHYLVGLPDRAPLVGGSWYAVLLFEVPFWFQKHFSFLAASRRFGRFVEVRAPGAARARCLSRALDPLVLLRNGLGDPIGSVSEAGGPPR